MNLSKNFWLDEFIESSTAIRVGIDNTPTPEAVENLRRLATTVLQPLRDCLDRPIVVTSGYRSPSLNKYIGGSSRSQHCTGLAADIQVPGIHAKDVCLEITRLDLPFDQLIFEGTWTHVSISEDEPRGEVLTAHFGKDAVTYFAGIRSV